MNMQCFYGIYLIYGICFKTLGGVFKKLNHEFVL